LKENFLVGGYFFKNPLQSSSETQDDPGSIVISRRIGAISDQKCRKSPIEDIGLFLHYF
jgi:hypothetical protein